jgi:2-methylcitrate dehydratase
LQYMTAIGLIFGELTADHYESKVAADPRIDALRDKMVVTEDKRYSREYLEADKRSIANAVQVFFKDGSSTDKIEVEYPVGHRRRRKEGIPELIKKATDNLATQFDATRTESLVGMFNDRAALENMDASEFVTRWVK